MIAVRFVRMNVREFLSEKAGNGKPDFRGKTPAERLQITIT
jgi:hypothetical protein